VPFLSPLKVEEISKREWRLTAPLLYSGHWQMFYIPEGFTTDFASVPPCFWWFVTPRGRHELAAVLHDWLYVRGCVSRKDADGIFRRVMREHGVGWFKRWAMYRAVRAFGGPIWRKARSRDRS